MVQDILDINFVYVESIFRKHLTNLQDKMIQYMGKINHQKKSWIKNIFDVNNMTFEDCY